MRDLQFPEEAKLKVRFGGRVYRGEGSLQQGIPRKPRYNSFVIRQKIGAEGEIVTLLMLSESLGEHGSEKTAGEVVVEVCKNSFEKKIFDKSLDLRYYFIQLFDKINQSLLDKQTEIALDMHSAVTVALITGSRFITAYTGDCRLYRIRQGKAQLLTGETGLYLPCMTVPSFDPYAHAKSHEAIPLQKKEDAFSTISPPPLKGKPSNLIYLFGRKKIESDKEQPPHIPPQVSCSSPSSPPVVREIIPRLGDMDVPPPSFYEGTVEGGDYLILCNRGLYARLSEEEITLACNPQKSESDICERLIDLSKLKKDTGEISCLCGYVFSSLTPAPEEEVETEKGENHKKTTENNKTGENVPKKTASKETSSKGEKILLLCLSFILLTTFLGLVGGVILKKEFRSTNEKILDTGEPFFVIDSHTELESVKYNDKEIKEYIKENLAKIRLDKPHSRFVITTRNPGNAQIKYYGHQSIEILQDGEFGFELDYEKVRITLNPSATLHIDRQSQGLNILSVKDISKNSRFLLPSLSPVRVEINERK